MSAPVRGGGGEQPPPAFPTVRRRSRAVLQLLGPLGALVALLWTIPIVGNLLTGADHLDDAATERIVMSSLLDEARRRDGLPVLSQLRAFGEPDDFQDLLLFADVVDDRLLAVDGGAVTPFDLESGARGPAMDLGGVIAAVGAVRSATITSQSELWIAGSGGFAQFDPAEPDRPARVIMLDRNAFGPMWFGDGVVASSPTTPLGLYEVDEDDAATLVRQDAPLFPVVDPGLALFFNLVSLTVHPDQRQLAVAFRLNARLHLHDRTGALTRAVAGPVEVKLDFDIVPRASRHSFGLNDETRMAYLDLDSDRSLIAALFAGRSRNTGARNVFAGDELHIFRWDGTLVGTWRLPEAVVSLQLDETRRRLYAVRQSPTWSIIELDAGPLYREEAGGRP